MIEATCLENHLLVYSFFYFMVKVWLNCHNDLPFPNSLFYLQTKKI